MIFGSVCSGIEAASVAWGPLGWKAAWFSEIDKFPCAVLAHHYPETPNLGDMTKIARRILTGEVEAPDVFTGGTPCQAFSVAGLRQSLGDDRGNLTLKFVEIADAIDHVRGRAGRPASIIVWENVPGVLSTKDNAFGCFLAGLAGEDGALEPPGLRWADAGAVYGPQRAVAWRTLDAQYFGLAQRRRRVFVVASARDDFDPAQVLFEWQGLRRDTAPSREAGQSPAATITAGAPSGSNASHRQRSGDARDALIVPVLQAFGGNNTAGAIDVATACNAHGGPKGRLDFESETFVAHAPVVHGTLTARSSRGGGQTNSPGHNADESLVITHSLRGEGFDAREDGTGRGTPLVPVAAGNCAACGTPMQIGWGQWCDVCGHDHGERAAHAFDARQSDVIQYGDKTGPLDTDGHTIGVLAFTQNSRSEVRQIGGDGQIVGALAADAGAQQQNYIAFSAKDHGADATEDLAPTLRAMPHHGSHANGGGQMAVPFRSATEFLPQSSRVYSEHDAAPALQATGARMGNRAPQVAAAMQVRRLTPRECERLQGFPDDYTLIPWRGRPAEECPDGPRYKALGNSWAINVVHWLGARIDFELQMKAAA